MKPRHARPVLEWRAMRARSDDGAFESDERVRVAGPVVEFSEHRGARPRGSLLARGGARQPPGRPSPRHIARARAATAQRRGAARVAKTLQGPLVSPAPRHRGWPAVIEATADEAHELSDRLGDDPTWRFWSVTSTRQTSRSRASSSGTCHWSPGDARSSKGRHTHTASGSSPRSRSASSSAWRTTGRQGDSKLPPGVAAVFASSQEVAC